MRARSPAFPSGSTSVRTRSTSFPVCPGISSEARRYVPSRGVDPRDRHGAEEVGGLDLDFLRTQFDVRFPLGFGWVFVFDLGDLSGRQGKAGSEGATTSGYAIIGESLLDHGDSAVPRIHESRSSAVGRSGEGDPLDDAIVDLEDLIAAAIEHEQPAASLLQIGRIYGAGQADGALDAAAAHDRNPAVHGVENRKGTVGSSGYRIWSLRLHQLAVLDAQLLRPCAGRKLFDGLRAAEVGPLLSKDQEIGHPAHELRR
jgi:hypothetical protein